MSNKVNLRDITPGGSGTSVASPITTTYEGAFAGEYIAAAILSSVNPLIEELQNKVTELEAKLSQEVEVVEENLSAQVKEEKLSKTFKHSPEVKGEKVTPKFHNNRVANTTLQRVFQKISNK